MAESDCRYFVVVTRFIAYAGKGVGEKEEVRPGGAAPEYASDERA
jgi:hypothetical protein